MKILVIGNGGREHAICWKIMKSDLVKELHCIPGNAGISELAICHDDIQANDNKEIVNFAKNEKIDLVVIGPEAPLVMGLTDLLQAEGIKVFGPNKYAAQLEGSKAYSKEFMTKYGIPTAHYDVFYNQNEALDRLKHFNSPYVIKADGLAAGKGVLICKSKSEAEDAISSIMEKNQFGDAGRKIVIEEFLDGIEASLLCFVDGQQIIPMESARDYKKAYDGDQGENTGGMGCFSPNPIFTEKLNEQIKKDILEKIMKGFDQESILFKGVLFIGLMIKNDQAKVLEFNVRFGDPETQAILPRMKSDLVEVMLKVIEGKLSEKDLCWSEEKSVAIVAASGGYPHRYQKGYVISGLDQVEEEAYLFHAGTKHFQEKVVTNGGRVLAVTCLSKNMEEARRKAYLNLERISFQDMQYRTDIASLE